MIHLIYINLFTHQNQVSFNDEVHYSSYNHNYYTSREGVIILEECTDDNTFFYCNVDHNTGNTEYYGLVYSTFGIFNKYYDGYPERDENGVVELDTDFC
jgi:hypothetical protein